MMNDDINKSAFQQHLDNQKLMGTKCKTCGSQYLPPRPLCNSCFGHEMTWVEMPTHGRLIAFSTIHIAPTAMIQAGYGRENPYCSGIVELENGQVISALILGIDSTKPEEIKIGTPLDADFVEIGEGESSEILLSFRVVNNEE